MDQKDKPWLHSRPPDMPQSLPYPNVALHEILRKTAFKHGERTAISFGNKETSYTELDKLSENFAASLACLGVEKGDRIAIYLPNIPQFMIAFFGILKAGGVVTTVSPLHREREVENQLSDSEAETIITLDSLHPVIINVRAKTRLRNVVLTNVETFDTNMALQPGVHSFTQLVAKNADGPNVKSNPTEDLAALQYTGGTTGKAKGAMLTHGNLVTNAVSFATWIRGNAEDIFLTALPLFHIYGLTTSMNVPISLGAKMVLLSRFDPATALASIQRNKVTVFCGVPTMYAALLAYPNLKQFALTSLRVCISGASPLPSTVQKQFMEISGGLLAEGYGLTEASPVTHCSPVDITKRTVRAGSIGLPIPDTEACILDLETGTKTLKPGETGELAVKGPQIMKGYWRNPEETALVLHQGWLLTGDIAHMDTEGYFYISDRKKDLIKYKDYSVYPRELEDVLYEHPAVRLCAVVGKPDLASGQIPKAFIVVKENTKVTEDEILKFVKARVAPYKQIREIEFRKDLPLSPAGKVLRRVLQEQEKDKAPKPLKR